MFFCDVMRISSLFGYGERKAQLVKLSLQAESPLPYPMNDCEKVSIFSEDKVFSFFLETFDAFSFSDFDWYTVPFFGTCVFYGFLA